MQPWLDQRVGSMAAGMRIGLIAPPWLPVPPAAYGGIEAVVDRLARGLAAEGHEVVLAAPAESTCPVTLIDGRQPAARHPDLIGNVIVELGHVATAYPALASMDVVHDHTVAGPFYRRRPEGLPVVTAKGVTIARSSITGWIPTPFRSVRATAVTCAFSGGCARTRGPSKRR